MHSCTVRCCCYTGLSDCNSRPHDWRTLAHNRAQTGNVLKNKDTRAIEDSRSYNQRTAETTNQFRHIPRHSSQSSNLTTKNAVAGLTRCTPSAICTSFTTPRCSLPITDAPEAPTPYRTPRVSHRRSKPVVPQTAPAKSHRNQLSLPTSDSAHLWCKAT